MENILTIGIPTYNRPKSLAKHIDGVFLSNSLKYRIKVLVINDGGPTEIDELLQQRKEQFSNLTSARNSKNLGFARTFLKLIEACETKYLMLMADDDLVLFEDFEHLFELINIYEPDFISPQWLRKNQIYRGQSKTAKIKPKDFMKSSRHAPGLIFKVETIKKMIPDLNERLSRKCSASETYPQVTILIELILSNAKCWSLAVPVAKEGDALPSGIKDQKGNHYTSFASRLQQAADFDAYILAFPKSNVRDQILNKCRNIYLIRLLRSKFF